MTSEKRLGQELVSLGLVEYDEAWQISMILDRVGQYFRSGFDLLLRSENCCRIWHGANDDIVINVTGGSASFEGTYLLGTEFLQNLHSLAIAEWIELPKKDRKGTALTFDGKDAIASSPKGTVSMSASSVNTEFRVIQQMRSVGARILLENFLWAVGTCINRYLDYGKFPSMRDMDTTISVAIINDKVICSGTINSYGPHKVTTTSPAVTSGNGVFLIPALLLYQMISAFWPRDKSDITISFDPLGGDFIEFSTEKMDIAIRGTVGVDEAA
jgi:hypothetical protein